MFLADLAVLAPLALSPTVTAPDFTCTTPIGAETSAADLADLFGADNVTTGEVPGSEGETNTATIVFPGDENREFLAYWWDNETKDELTSITLPADGTAFGLKLGMGIAEVEQINGEPFELTGFYWDYGGSGWFQTGKLANLAGGCTLSFSFSPTKNPPDGVSDEPIVGDRLISSDLPLLRVVETQLVSITIGYPHED